tara:strand:+ start:809 stop:1057 length:249 start_codon:yes stop_codon:yes gene_type:complete
MNKKLITIVITVIITMVATLAISNTGHIVSKSHAMLVLSQHGLVTMQENILVYKYAEDTGIMPQAVLESLAVMSDLYSVSVN